jgi:hypothetical protein
VDRKRWNRGIRMFLGVSDILNGRLSYRLAFPNWLDWWMFQNVRSRGSHFDQRRRRIDADKGRNRRERNIDGLWISLRTAN